MSSTPTSPNSSNRETPPIRLNVAEDVRRLLGPEVVAQAHALRERTFNCVFCREQGAFSADRAVSLVVVHTPPHNLCAFAHPACGPSQVIGGPAFTADMLPPDGLDVTTTVWIRPHWCTPQTVLVIRPRHHAFHATDRPADSAHPDGGRDMGNRDLVNHGFVRVAKRDQEFPFLANLHARITGTGHLRVSGPTRDSVLVECTLTDTEDGAPPWYQPAVADGRLGVVVLSMADPDPTLTSLDEVWAAIADGRAVAATAELLAAETATSGTTAAGESPVPRPGGHRLLRLDDARAQRTPRPRSARRPPRRSA